MPKTAGLKCSVVLASPEKVNETIHRLAIKMATEEKAKSWRLMFQLPDIGVVPWTERLSNAAKERAEEMQARAKPRVKPNASVIIAATNFTAAEEESFTVLTSRQRTREQKRLLHNRQHVEKKWHCLKPFERLATTILECENCGERIDFFRGTGINACFDWKFGQNMCEAQRAVKGVKMSRDEELVHHWNEKYEAHNRKRGTAEAARTAEAAAKDQQACYIYSTGPVRPASALSVADEKAVRGMIN